MTDQLEQKKIRPPWELGPIYIRLVQGKATLRDRGDNPIELPDGTHVWFESQAVVWIDINGSEKHAIGYPRAVYRSNEGGEFEFENGATAKLAQFSADHLLAVLRPPN